MWDSFAYKCVASTDFVMLWSGSPRTRHQHSREKKANQDGPRA